MKQHADKQTATASHRAAVPSGPLEQGAPATRLKGAAALAKRPDAVPPGRLNRIVYFSYAAIGLVFALYNTGLVAREMLAPQQDPAFSAAALFFCMGTIPTVFVLFATAGLKEVLLQKLGVKSLFIFGSAFVLFSLLLWSVLLESKADVRSMLIGFFLPMVVRVTFQDPPDIGDEAFQRIAIYILGALLGVIVGSLLTRFASFDGDAHGSEFAFSMVVLVSQLLQLWHASRQIIAIFHWERAPDAAGAPFA